MRMRNAAVLVLAVAAVGCAGISVRPATSNDRGIRYYQSASYLLLVSDNKGGITSQIVALPDTSRIMSAYVYGILATNESTLKFKNGYLSSAVADIDTGVIPKAALNAIATAALGRFNVAGGPAKLAPGPHLYRIVVNGNQAQLVGENETITLTYGTTE